MRQRQLRIAVLVFFFALLALPLWIAHGGGGRVPPEKSCAGRESCDNVRALKDGNVSRATRPAGFRAGFFPQNKLDPTLRLREKQFLWRTKMAPAKAALQLEPIVKTEPVAEKVIRAAPSGGLPQRLPNALARTEQPKPQVRPVATMAPAMPVARPRRDHSSNFQARVPVITGEATFRGLMPVDGIISGQLGANGSVLTIKQRPRSGPINSVPELNGEISFKDMLRVNGHIAGKVNSEKGTLIIDPSAVVDGDIEVGVVVVSGIVNGDVIGHQRVELGPAAVINGNISTRSLTMKPGAVFQGDCRMLKNENGD
jgi:cytoskeletal protein CcmA (bactofilin family)